VRIAGSSGKKGLDDAAIEAIRQAAPFGAPPDGASPDQLKFIIPFYFR
jgi:protein TonB